MIYKIYLVIFTLIISQAISGHCRASMDVEPNFKGAPKSNPGQINDSFNWDKGKSGPENAKCFYEIAWTGTMKKCVVDLSIHGVYFPPDTFFSFLSRSSQTLTSLDLEQNAEQIEPAFIDPLEQFLNKGLCLKQLKLLICRSDDEDIISRHWPLLRVLMGATQVKNLTLEGALIGRTNQGYLFLATLLSQNFSLETLDLTSNDIDHGSVFYNLGQNSTLKALTIHGRNYFDDETEVLTDNSADDLKRALAKNSSLTSLDLMGQAYGDQSVDVFAEIVKVNSTLQDLNLSGNRFSKKGKAALMRLNQDPTHRCKITF